MDYDVEPAGPPEEPPPHPGAANPPEPALWRVVVWGTVVFVISVVPVLVLKPWAPLLASYVGLFVPVIAGLALGPRGGSVAVTVSGFFAVAGCLGLSVFYDQAVAAAAGPFVSLASVAQAPQHPDATRFSFTDAHLAAKWKGSITTTTTSGKGTSRWEYLAAPVVPAGWTKDQAVPAWLTCRTSIAFDCLPRADAPVAGAVRVGPPDASDTLRATAAVRASLSTHGLRADPDAPVLELADDPEHQPQLRYAFGLMSVLAAWLAWALGMGAFRLAALVKKWRATKHADPRL